MIPKTQEVGVIGPLSIDNLIVLVAAIVGVLGSFLVYRHRLNIRKKKLRVALSSEISIMASDVFHVARILEAEKVDKNTKLYIPVDPITNDIFLGNVTDLGLLKEEEVEEISEIYSRASSVRQQVSNLQSVDSPTAPDVRKLRSDIIELNNMIVDTIRTFGKNIEGSWDIDDTDITKLEKPEYQPSCEVLPKNDSSKNNTRRPRLRTQSHSEGNEH